MSDVDEIVGVMINMSCRVVNEATDLLMQVIRAITGKGRNASNDGKSSLTDRAKDALASKIPGLGSSGEVSRAQLRDIAGEDVAEIEVSREDLTALKKELNRRGVAFHVLKNADDTVDVLFSGRSYALMESSLKAVAKEKYGFSDELIEELERPEITNLSKDPSDIEKAKNALRVSELTDKGYLGLDWKQIGPENNLTFSAENGAYDLKASADGTWQVSVMGKEHARGWSGEGVYSAATAARNASKALEKRVVLANGVDLGKSLGASSQDKIASNGHAQSVEELAQKAEAKAKEINAKNPVQEHSKERSKAR